MTTNQQNTFVTSVAILLVVVTLYFTTNALKRNYDNNNQLKKLEESNRLSAFEKEQQNLLRLELEEKEIKRQADISAKLKEHQDCCYDLQIFTAEILAKDQSIQQIIKENIDKSNEILLKQFKKTYRKKDLNKTPPPKKGASTEPIIYLFVLVLLYLLLKAASDITQHYKEQSKGDKRNNRRCSLQVYAQMKSDRRPSKENRLLSMNSRSKSVDRPILQRSKRIYPILRSYTSVDEHERSSCSNSTTSLLLPPTADSPSVENIIIPTNLIVPSVSRPKSLLISEIPSSRRCSVPAVSLQHLGLLSRRRDSIATFSEEDPLGLDIKKRHRMIQRH
ncbi:uncharacterized protein LOC129918396 [Episyrphus balteatus]|uniref:uncharacterized protein LOC129918396 n=1 Tax=Episyrphus balteatus TaxID=286459 RepID=UPI002485957F|nr:uncharacterized protein LOC129918396 [Episyrphus balteatus]XP_055854868.1 uncharacterized protein LOC129918396 [Episyrphus balteatus]XP_055854869.1 uncharacterized protein LOC129918396 [Episyrphus balteatus]XP_055854870.1 uncharacterized protein LOC129918396 [Episyrphus balteatus]XP_055854871.1 uncharacterized protein LOC129918396 [Episyrphus balteatus]XP_055854872.1 uncharacterized protein LOC129918396 [Episyrphus balteatus]XP_055854873.1 uncharacterized protein LOC129918396 [Episyrphus b